MKLSNKKRNSVGTFLSCYMVSANRQLSELLVLAATSNLYFFWNSSTTLFHYILNKRSISRALLFRILVRAEADGVYNQQRQSRIWTTVYIIIQSAENACKDGHYENAWSHYDDDEMDDILKMLFNSRVNTFSIYVDQLKMLFNKISSQHDLIIPSVPSQSRKHVIMFWKLI